MLLSTHQFIDQDDLDKLKEGIVKEILKAISTLNKPVKKSKMDEKLEELDGYIILKHALNKMGLSQKQWRDTFKSQIQHRSYCRETWVNVDSILDFYKRDNIIPPRF